MACSPRLYPTEAENRWIFSLRDASDPGIEPLSPLANGILPRHTSPHKPCKRLQLIELILNILQIWCDNFRTTVDSLLLLSLPFFLSDMENIYVAIAQKGIFKYKGSSKSCITFKVMLPLIEQESMNIKRKNVDILTNILKNESQTARQ